MDELNNLVLVAINEEGNRRVLVLDEAEVRIDRMVGNRPPDSESSPVRQTGDRVTIHGHGTTLREPSPAVNLAMAILAGDTEAALIAADLVQDEWRKRSSTKESA